MRWLTQICVAFDGLCCVASTILVADDNSINPHMVPNAGLAVSTAIPVADMHSYAPSDKHVATSVGGSSLLDLLLRSDTTLPRSVVAYEGGQVVSPRVRASRG